MTVEEAIEELKKLPPKMKIYYEVPEEYNSYYTELQGFDISGTFVPSEFKSTNNDEIQGYMVNVNNLKKPKKRASKKDKARYEYLIGLPKVVTLF
jgi:hypothetical protein